MTPFLRAVYDELLERATQPPFDERARTLRNQFAERCGRFEADDENAGERDAAAWEDVLVHGGLASAIADTMQDAAEADLARGFAAAQRGVFRFEKSESALVAHDLWSGAAFLLLDKDDIGRDIATASERMATPICEGRVLASVEGCAILPGAVFHPPDAGAAIAATLVVARERQMKTDEALDALLRMHHKFQTYTRLRVELAYSPDGLG